MTEHEQYQWAREQVFLQMDKFRQELPKLMVEHRGKWVVFRDGVVGFFATEDEADAAGLAEFGTYGGFVIAHVEEERLIRLPASAAYML